MASVTVIRSIHAPVNIVFQTVADADRFAQAISGVTKLEFLSTHSTGVGTRFRQSRSMNGKEATMDFEVTEYVKDKHVRIINETHGTIWDSLITLEAQEPTTKLTMHMIAKSNRLVPRLLLPLICLFITKAVGRDFDAVKIYCEQIKK